MNFLGLPDVLGKPAAVTLIDLLLAGDNALVIALVCRALPPRRLRFVLGLGTLGAVAFRIVLTGLAGGIFAVPGLKLAGGVLLMLVALNLARPHARRPSLLPVIGERREVVAATLVVVLVDVLMSLDNVVALAAVAGDDLVYLGFGLLLSISVVMFGAAMVGGWLRRHPDLGRLGAALLGWVAGRMALADPLVEAWIAAQAPALPLVVPLLAAAYAYLLGGMTPAPRVARPVIRVAPRSVPLRPVTPEPARARAPRLPAEYVTTPSTSRVELLSFAALFVIAGILLAAMLLFGGGLSG